MIATAQARGVAAAQGLTQRLAILQRLRGGDEEENAAEEKAEMTSEVVDLLFQVVEAFLYAADEATARQVFAQAPDLLLSDEAQEILNHGITADNEQSRRRLAARKTLIRKLRRERR